ncbi:MAG: hypothetical protein ACRC7N_09005 [Clostridium sp.]
MKKTIMKSMGYSLLIIASATTIAFAGNKTTDLSYEQATATGKLSTTWSWSGNDTGYASTVLDSNNGSKGFNTQTYIEYQVESGGARKDWATSSGNTATKTLSKKGVWRFNSSHGLLNSQGSEVQYKTQTDW